MQGALGQIEKLMRRYGHTYEANVAAMACDTFGRDPRAACRALNCEDWWSSSRSLAAVDLALDGGFTARARRDSRDLRQALIEVFTTMLAYGERNDGAEIMVSQFRKWLESHA